MMVTTKDTEKNTTESFAHTKRLWCHISNPGNQCWPAVCRLSLYLLSIQCHPANRRARVWHGVKHSSIRDMGALGYHVLRSVSSLWCLAFHDDHIPFLR